MFQHIANWLNRLAAGGADAQSVIDGASGSEPGFLARIAYYGAEVFLPYLTSAGEALLYAILALL